MNAAPLDLTSDMSTIAEHHQEGTGCMHRAGGFTDEEWSEHQRTTYVALMVLGIDGMQQLNGLIATGRSNAVLVQE